MRMRCLSTASLCRWPSETTACCERFVFVNCCCVYTVLRHKLQVLKNTDHTIMVCCCISLCFVILYVLSHTFTRYTFNFVVGPVVQRAEHGGGHQHPWRHDRQPHDQEAIFKRCVLVLHCLSGVFICDCDVEYLCGFCTIVCIDCFIRFVNQLTVTSSIRFPNTTHTSHFPLS